MRIALSKHFLPNRWSAVSLIALVLSRSALPVVANDYYTFYQLGQDIDGEGSDDGSGNSVSLSSDGKTVAIGAARATGDDALRTGHVRIYKFDDDGSWVKIGQDLDGEYEDVLAGWDVDLSSSGEIIAVGEVRNSGAAILGGQVRVFQYNGNLWEQLGADLEGEEEFNFFGVSLALSGDGMTLASAGPAFVGVHRYNGTVWNKIGQDFARAWQSSQNSVSLSSDGTVLAFGDYNQVRILEYDGAGWSQMGQNITSDPGFGSAVSLASEGNIIGIGAPTHLSLGAVFVFEYNGTHWNALGSPLHGDERFESFGSALEISSRGDRIVIGASQSCLSTGRVALYQYDKSIGSWVQLGEDLDGESYHDGSGGAVALSADGKILASGAIGNDGINGTNTGHVRVYESGIGTPPPTGNGYTLDQLGQDIDGEAADDNSGMTVSLSYTGKTVAIGAHRNDGVDNWWYDDGHARVYRFDDNGKWIQMGQDLDGEYGGDNAGYDVDLSSSGQIVAVGAIYNDDGAPDGGHVRVFQYNGDMWEQLGGDVDGKIEDENLGRSLSLSGDGTVLASAGTNYVLVHRFNGTSWNILGELVRYGSTRSNAMISLSSDGLVLALGEFPYNRVRVFEYMEFIGWNQMGQNITGPIWNFGYAVSLSNNGTVLGIGNHRESNGHGSVYVYKYNGNTWKSMGTQIQGKQISDSFGISLEVSGDGQRIAIGAYGHTTCEYYVGRIELYQYDGHSSWVQLGEAVGESRWNFFGAAVALSGDGKVIAGGANLNDGVNGYNSGHVRVYESKRLIPPGASGDPHFTTWNGESYDFHGLCDLVLLENHHFKSGLGMEIHIRTKKMKQWSYISNGVLRIGVDILEIMGDTSGATFSYWINGIEGDQTELTNNALLPYSVSGFPIFYRRINSKQHEFTVDLGDNEKIVMKTWKELVRIDIHGATETNFGESLGLMGSFGKGLHVGRDGTTILTEFNDFGQEWQVLASEQTLFHNREGAQAPDSCALPSTTKLRRRLVESALSQEQAAIACSQVDEADRDMCIFDVMATNDIEIIGAY